MFYIPKIHLVREQAIQKKNNLRIGNIRTFSQPPLPPAYSKTCGVVAQIKSETKFPFPFSSTQPAQTHTYPIPRIDWCFIHQVLLGLNSKVSEDHNSTTNLGRRFSHSKKTVNTHRKKNTLIIKTSRKQSFLTAKPACIAGVPQHQTAKRNEAAQNCSGAATDPDAPQECKTWALNCCANRTA